MAKNDNLTDFMVDIADAIREKKGTTELINPQDFSTEIRGISGGESGRTIYVEYKKNTPAVVAVAFSSIVKVRISVEGDEAVLVVPAIMVGLLDTQYTVETLAFTLDLDARVVITGSEGGIDGPIESALAKQGVDINTLPQITKEQFYDLTTEI